MIKDRITLGTVIGVIAAIPQLIFNFILVRVNFTDFYDFQISGSIYLYKNLTYTFWGLVFGGFLWELMAATLGILTVYLILWTGKEYWWLKSILVSNAAMFLLVYGLFYTLAYPKIVPWDLNTNWSIFIGNLIFGLTAGFLTNCWAENKERYQH